MFVHKATLSKSGKSLIYHTTGNEKKQCAQRASPLDTLRSIRGFFSGLTRLAGEIQIQFRQVERIDCAIAVYVRGGKGRTVCKDRRAGHVRID